MSTVEIPSTWVAVAPLERLPVDRGAAALVHGRPVAVFRLSSGAVYAIDHVEPFTHVPVLARGIVGSAGDVPTVASPLHKERFDLRDGTCLDDPDVAVDTFEVSVSDGTVLVSSSPRARSPRLVAEPATDRDHEETSDDT